MKMKNTDNFLTRVASDPLPALFATWAAVPCPDVCDAAVLRYLHAESRTWWSVLCVPMLFTLGPLQQGLWKILLMLLLPWLLLIAPNCLLSSMDSWPNTLLLKVFTHIFPSLTTEVNGSPDLSTDVSSLDTTHISLFPLQQHKSEGAGFLCLGGGNVVI